MTREPDPLIERRLAGWGAQIVSKRAFLAAGDWDAWGRAPVGTGPYKMKQLKSGEFDHARLARRLLGAAGRPPPRLRS